MKNVFKINLVILLVCGLLLGSCTAPTPPDTPAPTAEEVHNWKLFISTSYDEWAARELRDTVLPAVHEASGERLKIDPYIPNEHPYAKQDLLMVVRDRIAEMSYVSGGYLSGIEPHLAVLELPMIMPPDVNLTYEIYWKVFDRVFRPTLDRWDAQEVLTPLWPHQHIAASVPITDWNALKGQRIRTWSKELTDFVNMLNGIGVEVAFADVQTKLANGDIDGAISHSGALYDLGVFEHVKYLNFLEIQVGLPWLVVSKKALGELPADLRNIFLGTMRSYQDHMIQGALKDANNKTLAAVKDFGVTITPLSGDFRREVEERVRTAVWEPWADRAGHQGKSALVAVEEAKATMK
ncbi:TRAP transporter substrate-binding protein [Chloroflexota bacterium]